MREPAYVKTKAHISCAVTAQLISAFVFATYIVQSLFFLNPKFQAYNHLMYFFFFFLIAVEAVQLHKMVIGLYSTACRT